LALFIHANNNYMIYMLARLYSTDWYGKMGVNAPVRE
jgi:hypothetical protein